MVIVHDIAGLEREAGLGGVFVPTMGALHEGHSALVRRAGAVAGGGSPVVVSIFVNPTQFNESSDFAAYPRTLERDAALAAAAGATHIFAPEVSVIYPRDSQGRELFPKPAESELPEVARGPGLEDAARPGHFAGVYQVVKRLFELVRPRGAVFGEKDWQQLQLVRALVTREGMPIEIVAHETIREPDGLAMSSRNARLNAEERARAAGMWRAIEAARRAAPDAPAAERAAAEALARANIAVEYAAVREGATLKPLSRAAPIAGARVLLAGRLGATRLIDNASWPA